MQITIDTSAPLSDLDKDFLKVLLGEVNTAPTTTIVTEPAKAPRPKAPAKPAPEPEPEPEEDLIGGDPEPTVEDAIAAATAAVNTGQRAVVMAALKSIGVDRVSNIPQSKVAAFLAGLEG